MSNEQNEQNFTEKMNTKTLKSFCMAVIRNISFFHLSFDIGTTLFTVNLWFIMDLEKLGMKNNLAKFKFNCNGFNL